MHLHAFRARALRVLSFVTLLALGASNALAQDKPRIDKAADLPTFSYKVEGKVDDLITSPERFAPFEAAVKRDTESVLAKYDIADKAARRGLLNTLATIEYLDGHYDAALARAEEIRGLQDKPSDKLISGFRLRAMAAAAKVSGPSGDAFRKAVADNVKRELAGVPYPVVGNDIKSAKASSELISESLVLGQAREVMQPIVDRSGTLSSEFAPGVISARYALVAALPLKQTFIDTLGTYLAANDVKKPDIWAAREVTLEPGASLTPVVMAVWDSGVDTQLFPNQLLLENGQPAVIAFDKYSRPSSGNLFPLPAGTDAAALAAQSKGFSDLQSNLDSPEASAIKAKMSQLPPDQFKATIEKLRMGGNFVHGTHVAGIETAGNPAARIVVARIDFGYTLMPDPCPSDEQSARDAAATQAYVDFMRARQVRVVNMSWGNSISDYESDLEQCGIGKTVDERKALARKYFEVQKASLTRAFKSAPEILFVTAAGNSNDDATFIESLPSGIVLPNLLTVGAVDSAGEEAPFTSYGPTVKVHANGYQVVSFLPGGSRVALSGTSMASPQVANLAGKLLAVAPKLTPEQLVKIIVDTSDRSADGRRTLVNPKKALAAVKAT